ncbi:unnamed protein product [Pedinophyceae sp. YPF-701]|nr:unnamed protein product [Pedinophyceae sp. YPF-701]
MHKWDTPERKNEVHATGDAPSSPAQAELASTQDDRPQQEPAAAGSGLNPSAADFTPPVSSEPAPEGHAARGALSEALRDARSKGQPPPGARGGQGRGRGRGRGDNNPDAPPLPEKSPPNRRGFVRADHLLSSARVGGRGPRGGGAARGGQGRRGGGQGGGRGAGSGRGAPPPQPFSRELFVQASCRFLVSDSVHVPATPKEADRMIDWGSVIQVRMRLDTPPHCPIDMGPPRCPQVTPCGHIFSFASIIQHLMSHGGGAVSRAGAAAPCPLCFEPISARDLRGCVYAVSPRPRVGCNAAMALLLRQRDALEPHLAPQTDLPPCGPGDAAPDAIFHRTVVTSNPFGVWTSEARELGRQAAEVANGPEVDAAVRGPFVHLALESLQHRAATWIERRAAVAVGFDDDPATVSVAREVRKEVAAAFNAAESARARELAAEQRQRNEVANPLPRNAGGGKARPRGTLVKLEAGGAVVAPPPAPAAPVSVPRRNANDPWGRNAAASVGSVEAAAADASESSRAADEAEPAATAAWAVSVTDAASDSDDESDAVLPPPEPKAGLRCVPEALPGTSAASEGGDAEGGDFYFYQDAGGHLSFLHPLNVRMLLAHFGGPDRLPGEVCARVVEVEEATVTDAVRRRLRWLAHLPLTATYSLVELDLAPLLPEDTMATFAEEVGARRKRRDKAVRKAQAEDNRAKQRAHAEAARKKKVLDDDALRAMPLPGQSQAAAEAAAAAQAAEAAAIAELLESAPPLSSSEGAAAPSPPAAAAGTSFARITQLGLAATGELPALSMAAGQGRWGAGSKGAGGGGSQGGSEGGKKNKKGAKVTLMKW